MSSSDLMFLFEVVVETLKSCTKCTNYRIKARFGDIFQLKLRDPNELTAEAFATNPHWTGKKGKRKLKARPGKTKPGTLTVPTSQTVLVASDVESLIESMMKFPIELSLSSKDDPFTLGLIEIPWKSVYTDYLKHLESNHDQPPAVSTENYNVYDEFTSKRVAVVKLKVQMSLLENLASQLQSTKASDNCENPTRTFKIVEYDSDVNTGTIKTTYSGKQRKERKQKIKADKMLINKPDEEKTISNDNQSVNEDNNTIESLESNIISDSNVIGLKKESKEELYHILAKSNDKLNNSLANLVRSQTEIDNTNLFAVTKHWSSTSIEIKERLDILNYIFGNIDGPFGNKVYCVGYFTVDNSMGSGSGAKKSSEDPKAKTTEKKPVTVSPADPKAKTTEKKPVTVSPEDPKAKTTEKKPVTGTPDDPKAKTTEKKPVTGSPEDPKAKTTEKKPVTGTPNDPKAKTTEKKPVTGSPEDPKAKTTEKKPGKDSPPVKSSDSSAKSGAKKEEKLKGQHTFKICGSKCKLAENNPCFENVCSLDLSDEGGPHPLDVRKCTNVAQCDHKKHQGVLLDPYAPTEIDFAGQPIPECCLQKIEKVTGGVSGKLKHGDDPCYCTCDCAFEFVKTTTYCQICGGFELTGDDVNFAKPDAPFPCPIFHKLPKAKVMKVVEVEKKGKCFEKKPGSDKKAGSDKKSIESEKESVGGSKKKIKRVVDDRFKFNYGYKAPQIGHSQCAIGCCGSSIRPVPKHMGWLWTANIPGLKPRPSWKPGAANKHVVRMYKIAKNPGQVMHKRRRKVPSKSKRPLKRPLLIVQKKDGEYLVTMETMKTFAKPRTINQAPFEDKPALTYTIGRTDEENAQRAKRKARAERRLQREQRAFIRSAFQDMCKEICLKTCQQALGIMPYEEDLPCPCEPLDVPRTNPAEIDESQSCSCSDSSRESTASATDNDEWTIEFTPPNAYHNPAFVSKKIVKVDNSSQYSYLDYRVKLLDRFGNPIPRFFIGPDGKEQCSDLGGFWGPDNKWLDINYDGIVGVDGRWAPNSFIGPCGEQVDAELGKFQATNGVWLLVGIDGYVDFNNKWHFYSKPAKPSKDPRQQGNVDQWRKSGGCRHEGAFQKQRPTTTPGKMGRVGGVYGAKSEATWSCFGDASPQTLSQRGIVGHGHDRRMLLSTLQKLISQGEKLKLPQQSEIPKTKRKLKKSRFSEDMREYFTERTKCKHHVTSSEKGIVAVNDHGRKTYFTLKNYKNPRPKERIVALGEEGISLSSFHVPCFSSFISCEEARQRQREHILRHNARVMANAGSQTGRN